MDVMKKLELITAIGVRFTERLVIFVFNIKYLYFGSVVSCRRTFALNDIFVSRAEMPMH